MNREISFRGKRIDINEWVYGNLIHIEDERPASESTEKYSIDFISDIVSGYCCEVHSNSVSQYTGMKDKNENKIFEGDILKFTVPDGSIRYFTVEWLVNDRKLMSLSGFDHDGNKVRINGWCFVWNGHALYPTVIDGIPDNEHMEIVGNVYDSQEIR